MVLQIDYADYVSTEKRKYFEKLLNPTLWRNIMVFFFPKAFCPAVPPKKRYTILYGIFETGKRAIFLFLKNTIEPFF